MRDLTPQAQSQKPGHDALLLILFFRHNRVPGNPKTGDFDLDGVAGLHPYGRLAAAADIRFETKGSGNRLFLGSRDITEAVRSPEVTQASSQVSVHAAVRTELVARQRALGREGGVVMEGRDIGTKVFPDADLKIFLDASPEVRSERRFRDLAGAGGITKARVSQEIEERDRRDRERELSPLVPAEDSIYIDTTRLTVEEVVERILRLVEGRVQSTNH